MSKKGVLRIAPLQRVIAEPITDPAEQAALDKARMRTKRVRGGQRNRTGAKAASGGSRSE